MTTNGDVSPGARVKEARTKAGLSIRGLASTANISPAYLSKLESGDKTNPSTDVLQRIADALSTSLHELLGDGRVKSGSDLPEPREYLRRLGLSGDNAEEVAELIEKYKQQMEEG